METLKQEPAESVTARPRVGITMGDPAGIGPEVVLKAVAEPEVLSVCQPVIGHRGKLGSRMPACCKIELIGFLHELRNASDRQFIRSPNFRFH